MPTGLYYGTLASVRFLAPSISNEYFAGERPLTVGTGGIGRLFKDEGLFDEFVPEFPLLGLRRAILLSQSNPKPLEDSGKRT